MTRFSFSENEPSCSSVYKRLFRFKEVNKQESRSSRLAFRGPFATKCKFVRKTLFPYFRSFIYHLASDLCSGSRLICDKRRNMHGQTLIFALNCRGI
jgi:hypothetical protein